MNTKEYLQLRSREKKKLIKEVVIEAAKDQQKILDTLTTRL